MNVRGLSLSFNNFMRSNGGCESAEHTSANVFQIRANLGSRSKVALQLSIEQFVAKRLHSNALTVQILRSWLRYGIAAKCKRIAFALAVREQSGIFALSVDSDGVHIAEQRTNAQSTECHIHGEIDATQSALNELALRFKVKGEENDSALLFDSKARTLCYIITDSLSAEHAQR
jgi:hypothetical protein